MLRETKVRRCLRYYVSVIYHEVLRNARSVLLPLFFLPIYHHTRYGKRTRRAAKMDAGVRRRCSITSRDHVHLDADTHYPTQERTLLRSLDTARRDVAELLHPHAGVGSRRLAEGIYIYGLQQSFLHWQGDGRHIEEVFQM